MDKRRIYYLIVLFIAGVLLFCKLGVFMGLRWFDLGKIPKDKMSLEVEIKLTDTNSENDWPVFIVGGGFLSSSSKYKLNKDKRNGITYGDKDIDGLSYKGFSAISETISSHLRSEVANFYCRYVNDYLDVFLQTQIPVKIIVSEPNDILILDKERSISYSNNSEFPAGTYRLHVKDKNREQPPIKNETPQAQ